MTRVKICGITHREDALAAIRSGADALGFIFAESPRQITPDAAAAIVRGLPPFVCHVGVFVNPRIDVALAIAALVGLDAYQLHGDEPPDDCNRLDRPVIKRLDTARLIDANALRAAAARYRPAAVLLDPGAGSGRAFDWTIAVGLETPVIIAGGLTPENVAAAIHAARPYAVDVSSGVESSPGRKDSDKMHRFIHAVRSTHEFDSAR